MLTPTPRSKPATQQPEIEMKGTNTIIVNKQQMIEIINEWWGRVTYMKDRVTSVEQENMNFVIVLEEQAEDDETNS